MAAFQTQPWSKQPQFVPPISAYWLAQGVVSVLVQADLTMYDVVQGRFINRTVAGGVEPAAELNDYGPCFGAGAGAWEIQGTNFGGTEYTVLTVVSDVIRAGSNYNICALDDTGSNRCFQNRINSSNQFQFIPFDTAGSTYAATSTETLSATENRQGWIQLVTVINKAASIWKNGKKLASSTITGTPKGPSLNLIVNARDSAGTDVAGAGLNLIIIMNRGLTDDQAASLSANPWQVFGPRVVEEYFGAVFSGNTGYANEALQAITEQATGRTGVVGQVTEALQALSDISTGRTGALGYASEALQAITEQAYGTTQVDLTGFSADALQSITEASTGLTGARGIAREAFQSLAESATGTVTSNAVQGYASEALQSITENSVGRTGVRGIASESLQAMTETARGITGVRGVGVEALQSLQDAGFGESGAEPIAPTRQFGAPAWWGYEGFDGTRRPWWYRDLKDKAAEAERQRQIRIDLGIISAAESKKIKQTIRQVEKFADEIPTPAKADAYIAKAEQMAEKIERLVDDLQEEDDEQAIMQMSRFFFHRKSPERRAYS